MLLWEPKDKASISSLKAFPEATLVKMKRNRYCKGGRFQR
jgi:hypothetical protein